MMVPHNILRFEALLYASLLLDTLSMVVRDDGGDLEAASSGTERGVSALLILVFVGLVWLAARKRQNWARWVLIAAFALSCVAVLATITSGDAGAGVLFDIVSSVLTAAGLYYSFTGDAQGWFEPDRDGARRS